MKKKRNSFLGTHATECFLKPPHLPTHTTNAAAEAA